MHLAQECNVKITIGSAHGSGGTELANLESEANVAEENAVLGRTKDYALRKEAWRAFAHALPKFTVLACIPHVAPKWRSNTLF
jgi:hypothetical protein